MIYKFELYVRVLVLPAGSKFLTSKNIDGVDYVWVEMGKGSPTKYSIYYVGTGWDKDTSNDAYIGTVVSTTGYVWHWFAKVL